MAALLYLNRAEAQVLAEALNNVKLSSFSPSQKALIPKVARRLAGYIADGSTVPVDDNQAKPKKKLIGFKARTEDTELQQMRANLNASIEPPPLVIIDDRPPLPDVTEHEAIYATLRGRHK